MFTVKKKNEKNFLVDWIFYHLSSLRPFTKKLKEDEEEKLVKRSGFCRSSTVNRRRSTDNFVNDIAPPVPSWFSLFSTMFFPWPYRSTSFYERFEGWISPRFYVFYVGTRNLDGPRDLVIEFDDFDREREDLEVLIFAWEQ